MAPRSPYTAIKNIRFLPETVAYLDDLALRERTTSSDLIRRAVDTWIALRLQRGREELGLPLDNENQLRL